MKGGAIKSVDEVRAAAEFGLVGDRYFLGQNRPKLSCQLTLIEAENIEEFKRTTGLAFDADDARRDIVTRGIRLNPLLGQDFSIGEIRVRAIELCEPCSLLAKRTHREVRGELVHKGGLRCEILTSETIHVGDAVR